MEKYDVIYADPAWRYDFSKTKNRDIENQYPTMKVEDICNLPIIDITSDNCILYLWATAPKLMEALRVVDAWGFTYKTQAVWDKGASGIGYWFRGQHEILIVATKGKPKPPKPNLRCGSLLRYPNQNRLARINGKCNHHSLKPWEIKEMIKRWFPEAKKIELFSREKTNGFDAWGNEVESDINLNAFEKSKEGGEKTIKTGEQHNANNEAHTEPCNIYDVSNSVCFIPDNIECRFRNKKGECTSLGDCLKANDC